MHVSIENRLKKVVKHALKDKSFREELSTKKNEVLEDIGISAKGSFEIEFRSDIKAPIIEQGFLYIPLSNEWLEEDNDLSDEVLSSTSAGFSYNSYAYIKNHEMNFKPKRSLLSRLIGVVMI